MAITINGTPGSKTDIVINSVVQLDWDAAGTTFAWSILDQPPGTAETLSNPAIKNPTIQVTKEHTRRVQIVVDGTTTAQATISVRDLKTRTWIPSFGEATDEGSRGWCVPLEATLQYGTNGIARGSIVVGTTAVAGLVKGNVLRMVGQTTIKSGLPGQEIVFNFDKALATSAANLDEPLYVLEAGVDGSTTPASGALIVARFLGFHGPVTGASSVLGEPVFVSDAGGLVRGTPGTNRRVVGSVTRAGVSDFDMGFCGAALEIPATTVDFRSVPSGTAPAPGLAFVSDTGVNTGWFLQAQDSIGMATGGVERTRVNASGQLLASDGTAALPGIGFIGNAGLDGIHHPANNILAFDTNGGERFRVDATGISIGPTGATHPLTLGVGAAANGQAFYNTSDQATNYERAILRWSGNIFQLGTEKGGTGTARDLALLIGGTERVRVDPAGVEVGGAGLIPTHGLTVASALGATALAAYNTADQVTNYERLAVVWTANTLQAFTQKGGTGIARNMQVGSGGVDLTEYGIAGSDHVVRHYVNNSETVRITTGGLQVGAQNATHALTVDANFKPTAFASYNTADQTTNYERLALTWSAGVAQLFTQAGGTGVARNFRAGMNATDYTEWGIVGSDHVTRHFANGAEVMRSSTSGTEIGAQTATHGLTISSGFATNALAVYGTADQTTNYERLVVKWVEGIFTINTEKAGTGATQALQLSVNNTYFLQLGTTGNLSLSGGGSMYIDTGAMYAFNSDTATGMLRSPAHVLSLLVDGNSILQVANLPATSQPTLFIQGITFSGSAGTQRGTDMQFSFGSQTGTAAWDAMRVSVSAVGAGSGGRRLLVLASAAGDRWSVAESGTMRNHNAANEATAANAGANGAPPAQVVGYLTFIDSGAVNRKIPYYAF